MPLWLSVPYFVTVQSAVPGVSDSFYKISKVWLNLMAGCLPVKTMCYGKRVGESSRVSGVLSSRSDVAKRELVSIFVPKLRFFKESVAIGVNFLAGGKGNFCYFSIAFMGNLV
jgi:hypothetical protein